MAAKRYGSSVSTGRIVYVHNTSTDVTATDSLPKDVSLVALVCCISTDLPSSSALVAA